MYSSNSGSNFRTLNTYGATNRHFWAIYDFYSQTNYDNSYGWPTWYAGEYYDFTFRFSSMTGDVSNDAT